MQLTIIARTHKIFNRICRFFGTCFYWR